ncbi:Ger(x)C family spore germination protein [Lysinibacillus mangiferihumi]|uniref:Ger(X)C family spore germination protein n=1 Tax=Lysinibacillus mangiferihumi TaxID=1130819 RepID=A0A4U2ZF96_9BACI|nr:Ger(x)C family spore germination protein [Lysinibacillus mangiferihumi]TKI71971.1 Ger(x)C family spore germination protein [Lysinibacillus mangiferihumi]
MRKTLIFLFILFALFISGCGGKRELNELAIVVGMGIDKAEDGYEVSLQVVNPSEVSSKQGNSGRSPVVTYHAKGKSVFEAIRQSTTVTPRKPYFSHIQILVLGEELAKNGISESLDFFSRDHELRSDFYVIVSDETTAKDILSIYTPLDKIPASKMYNSLEVSEKVWAPTSYIHIHDLINEISKKGQSAVLTNIRIDGEADLGKERINIEKIDPPAKLKYSGLAVFKQDKLVGLLTEDESKGYNYLKNNINNTLGVIACPKEGNLSIELSKVKTKVKGKVKNGVPSIHVNINIKQNVGEVNCSIDLSKEETNAYINKKTEDRVKTIVGEALDTIQKDYQVDVLGFGEVIHRTDYKEWRKIEDKWHELFPYLEVNVSVEVKTIGSGTKINSILH